MRRAFVGPFGLIGDRRHAVEDEDGTPLSARRVHGLLGFVARYADGEAAEGAGVTTPSGWELDPDDPALSRELAERLDGEPPQVGHDPDRRRRRGGQRRTASTITTISRIARPA